MKENGLSCPRFCGDKLRQLLPNHEIVSQIAFTTLHPGNKGFISYVLIYNANLTDAKAVKFAYRLGLEDSVMKAAEYLRQVILDAFKNSKELPWPPTADDLDYSPVTTRAHKFFGICNIGF